MLSINRVTLLGNATHDPEAKNSKTGTAVTTIGFATSERRKGADGKYISEPEYHRLVCFGKLAEFSGKSVAKGSPLYVEGKLHTSHYKNKEGKDMSRTEILVDQLVMLSKKD